MEEITNNTKLSGTALYIREFHRKAYKKARECILTTLLRGRRCSLAGPYREQLRLQTTEIFVYVLAAHDTKS